MAAARDNLGRQLRRLAPPCLMLLAAGLLALFWPRLAALFGWPPASAIARLGGQLTQTLAWLAGAYGLIRLLAILLWQGLIQRRSGRPVPRLLSHLVAGLIWLATGLGVLAFVFGQPIAGLATTSGVAIAIIGFALRDIIASLFAGIAINLDRPYQIGDWIEAEPGVVGRVVEISWLTTRAVTRDGIGLVVPNSKLATAPFRNYNQPSASWRDQVAITLDHGEPGERVERILLAAMNAVPQVRAQPTPPDVKIEALNDWGTRWQARYWVGDYGAMPEIRYAVYRSILRHLQHAGIRVPYPKRDVFATRLSERQRAERHHLDEILAGNELFDRLPPDELRQLALQAQPYVCPADLPIVQAGDPGASLFVVVEGLLRVLRPTADGGEKQIEELGPGGAFGHLSLLTGAARTATVVPFGDAVVYEITKADLKPLLERHPELVERWAWLLAHRQLRRQMAERGAAEAAEPVLSSTQLWLARVRAFFGLTADQPGQRRS